MIKLIIVGRRCAGKARNAALAHLKSVHGPLVFNAPADAGAMPRLYSQNHTIDAPMEAGTPWRADRDLVTEIWFDDMAHLRASVSTDYYKNVLQPDEGNFVDKASVLKAVVAESEHRGTVPEDATRHFLFLKRKPGIDAADFETARIAVVSDALADPSIAAFCTNTPLPGPDGSAPFADSIALFSFAGREAASAFENNTLPKALATLADVADETASFTVLADHYPVERLRKANGL